ncbi:MAG: hypothetical protein LIO81_02340 [Clostridiales bacterium]|nr:hypothetical protein [Clostridiales bacterium]
MNEQTVKDLLDVVTTLGHLNSLLYALRDSCRGSMDESKEMGRIGDSLEIAAGVMDDAFFKLDDIYGVIGEAGHDHK